MYSKAMWVNAMVVNAGNQNIMSMLSEPYLALLVCMIFEKGTQSPPLGGLLLSTPWGSLRGFVNLLKLKTSPLLSP